MQLLLIECSKSYSGLLQKLLKNSGASVSLATSLEQALGCIKEHSYDAIYSSTFIDKDKATLFCQQLRSIPKHQKTPCIIYATDVTSDRVDEYKSSGADDFIAKSELIETLLNRIETENNRNSIFNIVHIEDDRVMQILMKTYLASLGGINLSQFALGKEGIAYIEEHCPDVLLLDMNLPDSNGWEIATHLKQAPITKDLPIIAITGEETLTDEQQDGEQLFTQVIKKPFNQSIIEQLITQLR